MTGMTERDRHCGIPPPPTREELNELQDVYQQALDEYENATSAVMDRVRGRSLPTAEEFARKRAAQIALGDARRAFWKASRQSQRLLN